MTVRLGVIARSDNRGLGVQCTELVRHMKPTRVLLMDMEDFSPYVPHFERYVGARVTQYTKVTQEDIDYLLDGIDVLYTAETPYDDRIIEQARERGIATCIQGNYEFLLWVKETQKPRPDLFLAPSTWHLAKWPAPTLLLPFPVARDRLKRRPIQEASTFLHIAGHRAGRDRNGTNIVIMSLRYVQSQIRFIIRAQSRIPSVVGRSARNVQVEVHKPIDLPNYWDLYEEGDVLVAPRRYGGLSLPMQEAMAAGMPIISLDVAPQNEWIPKEGLVVPHARHHIESQAGPIAWWDARPRDIANRIDVFAGDPELVGRLADESDQIAECLSWRGWGVDAYTQMLETLVKEGAEAAAALRLWCLFSDVHCPCPDGDPCLHEKVPTR